MIWKLKVKDIEAYGAFAMVVVAPTEFEARAMAAMSQVDRLWYDVDEVDCTPIDTSVPGVLLVAEFT